MRLSKITLNNFRSFKGEHEIELSPITLLFGANSVGKSTVIKAIQRHSCLTLEEDAYHGEDSVSVGLEFETPKFNLRQHDLNEHTLNDYWDYYIELKSRLVEELEIINASDELKKITRDFAETSIEKVKLVKGVYKKKFKVEALDKDGTVNYKFVRFDYVGLYVNNELLAKSSAFHKIYDCDYDLIQAEVGVVFNLKHPFFNALSAFKDILNESINEQLGDIRIFAPIVFDEYGKNSAKKIHENRSIFDYYTRELKGEDRFIVWLASYVVLNSAIRINYLVREGVDLIHSLGPLRKIPNDEMPILLSSSEYADVVNDLDGFVPKKNIQDGMDAWESLIYKENAIRVNTWLKDWFCTAYEIDFKRKFTLTLDSSEKMEAIKNDCLKAEHFDSDYTVTVLVRNVYNNSVTRPDNIGVGISQLVPVINYAVTKKNFSVEQPELHIHPRMQTIVGDLFVFEGLYTAVTKETDIEGKEVVSITTKNLDGSEQQRQFIEKQAENKSFILAETHSEHLMLRLLKRVREGILKPEDLAVYYFQNDKGATSAVRIGVNEEGDFTNQWPEGFFEERLEELF